MAMKPAGKAIVAAGVVLIALAGAHFSGVFEKLQKQGETVQQSAPPTVAPSEPAPAPQAAPVETPKAEVKPEPAPSAPTQRQSDAFDQLIRQSGKK